VSPSVASSDISRIFARDSVSSGVDRARVRSRAPRLVDDADAVDDDDDARARRADALDRADALEDGRSTLDDARMLDDLGRRRRRRAGRRASVSRRADDAARSIRAKKLDNRVCDTVR
tara:strand:- start:1998 stop:2351 length:354 start_codon:yes stop_codon:yes gene_type:complete